MPLDNQSNSELQEDLEAIKFCSSKSFADDQFYTMHFTPFPGPLHCNAVRIIADAWDAKFGTHYDPSGSE